MSAVIPLLFIIVICVAAAKKIDVYACFTDGIKKAIKFVLDLLPCLAAVFMMCEAFEVSGLSQKLTDLISPITSALGVPKEITRLLLLKPFSGSASLALLSDIIAQNGADSYISRCACVCYGSSETVFYVSAVYFAGLKNKRLSGCIFVILLSSFISALLACQICKIL